MNRRRAILLGAGLPAVTGLLRAQHRDRDESGPDSRMPAAKNDAEKKILDVIAEVRRSGEVFLEVPTSEGRMLRLLTETSGAKRVAEIGTSTGYSGLWFLVALRQTGGRLTTFEIDRGRAALARKHFERAGVDQLATVIEGDAHENVKQLKEPLDIVFLDADKEGYADYLKQLLPLVRPGGLILADNYARARAYGEAIAANPELETLVQAADFSITLKKR